MNFPMTKVAEPLDIKPIFCGITQKMMSVRFNLSPAQIAKLWSNYSSRFQGTLDSIVSSFSCFVLRVFPVLGNVLKNPLSIVPVILPLLLTRVQSGFLCPASQVSRSLSVVLSTIRSFVVRAQIAFSASLAPRHKAAGLSSIYPKLSDRLFLFTYIATWHRCEV
jgi:hypothetical protein